MYQFQPSNRINLNYEQEFTGNARVALFWSDNNCDGQSIGISEPTVSETPSHISGVGVYHPDFGKRVDVLHLNGKTVGEVEQFVVVQPLEVYIYQNEDGFTAEACNFDGIFGFGDSVDEAVSEVLQHLTHIRQFYGNIDEATCTHDALVLRELLIKHLRNTL
jgi:hypothetical protein